MPVVALFGFTSDIKLVSLFSKKVLAPPLEMCCTDLTTIQSAGKTTYLLSLVKLDGPPLNSDRRDEKVPLDRGEVRSLAGGLNIEHLIEGIGFMAIEDDFIIF